jgi:hypothetical protein
MAKTQVELPFPLRGINRVTRRSDQPEGTTWDCLNVLPFDATGRGRGGQRPGLRKRAPSALVAASPVQALAYAVIPFSAAAASPDTVVFSEDFSDYTNGTDLNSLENWIVALNITVEEFGDAGRDDRAVIQGGRVQPESGQVSATAIYASAIPAADVSSVTITATPNVYYTNVYIRVGAGSPSNDSYITCGIKRDRVFLEARKNQSTSKSDSATLSPTLPSDEDVELEVVCRGEEVVAKLDGSVVATLTVADDYVPHDNPGCGINLRQPTAGQGVSSFTVKTGKNLTGFVGHRTLALCSGSFFLGEGDVYGQVQDGAGVVGTTYRPTAAFLGGSFYVSDFEDVPSVIAVENNRRTALSASAGTAPANCRIAAAWRGRLILASPPDNPQNFFFSRVGDPTDWDYSQSDPAAAFAGNASASGRVGDPITAIIPVSEDVLIIAGRSSMYAVRGDPADGGSIDLLTDGVGVLQPQSWCRAPDGTVYFCGSDGLYRMSASGSTPENLSINAYPQYFIGLQPDSKYLSMAWDSIRHGVWLFATPAANDTPGVHLFWDVRTQGFFPVQLADKDFDPVSCVALRSGDLDKVVLLGGKDGVLRSFDTYYGTEDDGTAFSSHVWLGPVKLGAGNTQGIVTNLDFTLGELPGSAGADDFYLAYDVYSGRTAEEATEAASGSGQVAGYFDSPGRPGSQRKRLKGAWASVRLSGGDDETSWSFEGVRADIESSGLSRK